MELYPNTARKHLVYGYFFHAASYHTPHDSLLSFKKRLKSRKSRSHRAGSASNARSFYALVAGIQYSSSPSTSQLSFPNSTNLTTPWIIIVPFLIFRLFAELPSSEHRHSTTSTRRGDAFLTTTSDSLPVGGLPITTRDRSRRQTLALSLDQRLGGAPQLDADVVRQGL